MPDYAISIRRRRRLRYRRFSPLSFADFLDAADAVATIAAAESMKNTQPVTFEYFIFRRFVACATMPLYYAYAYALLAILCASFTPPDAIDC